MRDGVARARSLIQSARTIDVVGHIRPDGDAIGSTLALSLSLLQAGKQARPVLSDGVPPRFEFLPGAEKIQQSLDRQADLWIVVDSSSLDRIGIDELANHRIPDLNIDHHPTNTMFAKLNLVEDSAAATAEILSECIEPLGLTFTTPVATNLLAGILTDTLGFRTSNVTPHTLENAANLMALGADLNQLYQKLLLDQSFEAARYWSAGLTNLVREGLLVWTQLRIDDRHETGYPANDDAELINWLSSLEKTHIIVVFLEQPGQKTKVSWRSRDGVDVSKIAEGFGGGGHKAAAGAMIDNEIDNVIDKVLSATRLELNSIHE